MDASPTAVRAELVEAGSCTSVRAEVSKPFGRSSGAPLAEACWPGVARQQVTFFCFAKRKSPKKRRPAVWVPTLRYGQPAVLEPSGVRLNSLRSNNAGPDPLVSALLGPARTGKSEIPNAEDKEVQIQTRTRHGVSLWLSVFGVGCWYSLFPPLVYAPRSGGSGGSGIALFERSEFSETPPEPSTAGCPVAQRRGRRHQGRLSFAYFSLAKQRKVSCRRATPGEQAYAESAPLEQDRRVQEAIPCL